MNELSVRWVAERSWTYRTSFETPETRDGDVTELVFEGLDTLATVKLNHETILEADNMFLKYRTDVTALLTPNHEKNQLEIVFDSALLRGRELVKQHEHEHRHIAHQTEPGSTACSRSTVSLGMGLGTNPDYCWYLETHLAGELHD